MADLDDTACMDPIPFPARFDPQEFVDEYLDGNKRLSDWLPSDVFEDAAEEIISDLIKGHHKEAAEAAKQLLKKATELWQEEL